VSTQNLSENLALLTAIDIAKEVTADIATRAKLNVAAETLVKAIVADIESAVASAVVNL